MPEPASGDLPVLPAGSRRSSRATETLSLGAAACHEPSRAGMLAGERGSVSEVSPADHRGFALSAGGHLEPADACGAAWHR